MSVEAAGGETDDDAHRPRRIGLRVRRVRGGGANAATAAAKCKNLRRGSFIVVRSPAVEARACYSAFTAAALMIGVQRAISSFTNPARGC